MAEVNDEEFDLASVVKMLSANVIDIQRARVVQPKQDEFDALAVETANAIGRLREHVECTIKKCANMFAL